MRTSRDRILITHVGSLPRGPRLNELLVQAEGGELADTGELDAVVAERVAEVFNTQLAVGIDIPNDGEQGRVGFQTYVAQRMSGFAGQSNRRKPREFEDFPLFAERLLSRFPRRGKQFNAPQAVADVHYQDKGAIRHEIELLKRQARAAGKQDGDVFMTAPSPGMAREMRNEYSAISDAGFILQIDAPDLAMDRHIAFQDLSEAEYVGVCETHVAAINSAIHGLPRDRIRLHCCWGNWEGPHTHDIALASILPVLVQAQVGALSIEFGNPRHQHEFDTLRHHKLPDDMILIPGVIDSTSSFVEHPQVVARRIEEAVAALGDRERVIASTDCGFGTFAGREWVTEDVVWAKLRSLRQGADIASAKLWGKTA
jgi:5-methyltetrahydropteroyltriglutamate--homocysteine methyltransferase